MLPKSCRGFSEPLYELMDWKNECKYRFRGQYFQEDNEQILLFDLEEPEIFKRELQDILSAESTSDTVENETIEIEERQANTVTKTLYPEKWKKHFGNRTDEITVFQRIYCCGNWDVLRPAQVIEGMALISEEILKKINDETQDLIEKMRCAV